jgi:hypothetical protein
VLSWLVSSTSSFLWWLVSSEVAGDESSGGVRLPVLCQWSVSVEIV